MRRHLIPYEPPAFDFRVMTLVSLAFVSGIYAAANTGAGFVVRGSGNIPLALLVSCLRYFSLVLLCDISVKLRFMQIFMFLYAAVSACVFGFFTYAYLTWNTVVLLSVILPMLIYCYTCVVFPSAVLKALNAKQSADIDEKSINARFFAMLFLRWRIVAVGIFLEGVVAPWL